MERKQKLSLVILSALFLLSAALTVSFGLKYAGGTQSPQNDMTRQYEHGNEKAFISLGLQVFGVFFIGVLGAYGVSLNQSQPHGNLWLLVTIALVWLVDAGAYLIGSRFGKRKILPRLSPNKTLEGLIGGTLVGLLSGVLKKEENR